MTRFLRLSEAIEELRRRAYGNFAQPAKLREAKRANPAFSFRDGWRSRDAARRLAEGLVSGALPVFTLPSTLDKKLTTKRGLSLDAIADVYMHPVPSVLIPLLPRSRGVPWDRPLDQAWRIPELRNAADAIDRKLLSRLSSSTLVVCADQFQRWINKLKKGRRLPSQRKAGARPRVGAPRIELTDFILARVRSGEWSTKEPITRLQELYRDAYGGVKLPSESTFRRRVRELVLEHDDEGLRGSR